jgi:hypothetical protein
MNALKKAKISNLSFFSIDQLGQKLIFRQGENESDAKSMFLVSCLK